MGGKTISLFLKKFDSSEKTVYEHIYSFFELRNNENSSEQFVANFLLTDCKDGYKGGSVCVLQQVRGLCLC